MSDQDLSRRSLLARGAGLATLCSLSTLPAMAEGLEACFDGKTGDVTKANALDYTEAATDLHKICDVCKFFDGNSQRCGFCKLLKAPVNPGGTCNNWAEIK